MPDIFTQYMETNLKGYIRYPKTFAALLDYGVVTFEEFSLYFHIVCCAGFDKRNSKYGSVGLNETDYLNGFVAGEQQLRPVVDSLIEKKLISRSKGGILVVCHYAEFFDVKQDKTIKDKLCRFGDSLKISIPDTLAKYFPCIKKINKETPSLFA